MPSNCGVLFTTDKYQIVYWKVYVWLGLSVKVATLCFHQVVKFGFGELSISRICAESRDLGPEHGCRACSLENKGNKLDFHI